MLWRPPRIRHSGLQHGDRPTNAYGRNRHPDSPRWNRSLPMAMTEEPSRGEGIERLWAPWRLEYITRKKSGGCIFCDKPLAGDDRANYIVFRGTHAFVLLNAYPYNNGHLMIAPYAHLSELDELPRETLSEMMDLCQDATHVLRKAVHADGMNIGFNLGAAAGAGIKDHLHLHVVPRWFGDTNFMPVISDVRVIPQSLERAWEELSPAFRNVRADD
jgi:ATP adenylyltransferase